MPRVTEITVSAGRTFNHPYESYANLKPMVTVRAALEEGEDWQEATKSLQATAERLVEDHKRHMLASIEELEQLSRKQAEVASIEASIVRAQAKLAALRRGEADSQTTLELESSPHPDDRYF